MERERVWPDFREAWIVHEDDDIMVVDKPSGVSSQAADAERPDDLATRLKRWLRARGASDYLGIHQRLDRDTSGLLVYARRREANAPLAAQFEKRSVSKTYVACVTGWPERRETATLNDWLAPDKDGNMRIASSGTRGAKRATTRVRVLSRRAGRALLELSLDTGRTHQARVQLAHAGAAIGGDGAYGGRLAPRLMLHASALAFDHPRTGRHVRFSAPVPAEFQSWLSRSEAGHDVYDDASELEGALARAIERRWLLGRSENETTAFRLVNEEGDGLPRLAVDVYGAWLVAQLYDSNGGPWEDVDRRERVLDVLATLGFDGVYLKVRPRQANVIVDSRRAELAPALPVRGVEAPQELTVVEEGVPLMVRLGDGLSTGLFLDQRANRKRAREMAGGSKVANLFAYTCAFSVAAARGGAVSTVSVDVSAGALERGRANFALAGIDMGDRHLFVADDVFRWLERTARRKETFDLVVVDPPSYSTTQRGRFVADDDYAELAAAALRILRPGGRLLACTNHRGISAQRFRRMLFDGSRRAERDVRQIKDLPIQSDYPVPAGADPNMKSALVTLR
jgi:23S rRNA (cytosine1962-C5)-methyltransferase